MASDASRKDFSGTKPPPTLNCSIGSTILAVQEPFMDALKILSSLVVFTKPRGSFEYQDDQTATVINALVARHLKGYVKR